MRTARTTLAAVILVILAACGNNNDGPFPEAAITGVNPAEVGHGAQFTVTGRNFYAVNGTDTTRIEACGVTLSGSLVEPRTSSIVLAPGSSVTAQVSNAVTATMPANGITAGVSDVRVTRPDGSTAVLENAVTCVIPSPQPEPTPATAVITASSTSGVAPATINFSAAGSTGEGNLDYTWDFGVEGTTGNGVEVSFKYLDTGTFTVQLTVTDEAGAEATAQQVVTVHPPLHAVIEHSEVSGFAPIAVTFDGTDSTGIAPLTYAWSFGTEGATSTEAQPTFGYQTGGTYTVELTVTDAKGDQASTETQVVIPTATPVAAVINASAISGIAPATISFDATGSSGEGDLEYHWIFGITGATSTHPEPTHTFLAPGDYTVTLTVTDELDKQAEATQQITVHPPLRANIQHSPVTTYAPTSISFDGSGSTGIDPLEYEWHFGDGSTSTQVSPTHAYQTGGTYTVELTVTDTDGNKDMAEAELVIPSPTRVTAVINSSATVGAAPVAITFDASGSTGEEPLEYRWDFGDGNTSNDRLTTNQYQTPGTYVVKLTVIDGTGSEAETTEQVTIHPPFDAVIQHSVVTGHAPITVDFDATGSTGIAPLSFEWDFGDGIGTSTQAQASYEYRVGGTYTVELTVTDGNDKAITTDLDLVIASPTPVNAVIYSSTQTGVAPATIIFAATGSTGQGALKYQWHFGDGNTSEDALVSNQYQAPGTYTATLAVTDVTGAVAETTEIITIDPPLQANIQHSAVTTSAPASISFDATSSTGIAPLTYSWNFGDGATSTQASPTHEYQTGGTYTVELTVTDAKGAQASTETQVVIPTATPVAAIINTSAINGIAPATISFDATGSSGEGKLAYHWNFGVAGATSTQPEPTHTFHAPGTYTVTLTVTDELYKVAKTTQQINIHPPLQANIQHSPVTTHAPTSITFDGSGSTGIAPLEYEWHFGDGGTSTQASPTHEYQAGGTYTVELTVTDTNGDTDSVAMEITIPSPTPVNAVIYSSTQTGVAPATIIFAATGSTGQGALRYQWDFGDGNTSQDALVSNQYQAPGTYTVTLKVKDELDKEAEVTQHITVHPPLQAVIQHSALAGYAPMSVSFDAANSTGIAPLTYSWDFGEGSTSTLAAPVHEYKAGGTYKVSLTVTDTNGNTNTTELDLVIPSPTPVRAVINTSSTTLVAPATVTFDASSSTGEGPFEFKWDFGDGNTSNDESVIHRYQSPGTYTVTLTVMDETGSDDETTEEITVHPPLQAIIQHSPITSYGPITVDFDATASTGIAPLTYSWKFGDGGTSNLANPSHEFQSGGTYSVELTVTDADNKTNTTELDLDIPFPTPVKAVINASGATPVVPATVTFSAAGSTGEGPLEYLWEFADGTGSNQAEAEHTFTVSGTYLVKLTVTDETGASDTTTQEIAIVAALASMRFNIEPIGLLPATEVQVTGDDYSSTVSLPDGQLSDLMPGTYTITSQPYEQNDTFNGETVHSLWSAAPQVVTVAEGVEHTVTLSFVPTPGALEFTLADIPAPWDDPNTVRVDVVNTPLGVVADTSNLNQLVPGLYELTASNISIQTGDPSNNTAWVAEYAPDQLIVQLAVSSGKATGHEISYRVIPVSSLSLGNFPGLPAGELPTAVLTDDASNHVPEPWSDLNPGHYQLEFNDVHYLHANGITRNDGTTVDASERYSPDQRTLSIYLSSNEDAVHGASYGLQEGMLEVEITAPPGENTADVTITDAGGAEHRFTSATSGTHQLFVPIGEYHVKFNDPYGYASIISGRTPAGYNLIDESYLYDNTESTFRIAVEYVELPKIPVTFVTTPYDLQVDSLNVLDHQGNPIWDVDERPSGLGIIEVQLPPGDYTIASHGATRTVTYEVEGTTRHVTEHYTSVPAAQQFTVSQDPTPKIVNRNFALESGSIDLAIQNLPSSFTAAFALNHWNGTAWQEVSSPDLDSLPPGVYELIPETSMNVDWEGYTIIYTAPRLRFTLHSAVYSTTLSYTRVLKARIRLIKPYQGHPALNSIPYAEGDFIPHDRHADYEYYVNTESPVRDMKVEYHAENQFVSTFPLLLVPPYTTRTFWSWGSVGEHELEPDTQVKLVMTIETTNSETFIIESQTLNVAESPTM